MLPSEQYAPNRIKQYQFWDLFVSEKQRYLGRTYIWWRDRSTGEGENMPFDALPDEALLEVKRIWRDVVRACNALGYKTDPYGEHFKLNTCYLANERQHHNGHMHIHFIPRTSFVFTANHVGVQASDDNFEKMYLSGGNDRLLDAEPMSVLRNTLQKSIKQ